MTSASQFQKLISSIIIILITVQPSAHCGFADTIETPHGVDHVISGRIAPRINDNTSLSSSTRDEKRQAAFLPANYAGNHLTAFANMANLANFGGFGPMGSMGSLRTVMMGGMLYGLSLIPAVVLALGGSGLPLGGVLSSLGLSKRALPDTSSAKMPLLSENQTRRLLQMLQSAFKQWNVADEDCKQLFVCQMYRQVSTNGVSPDLELFKEALLHILERGGQRRASRAAEHLLAEYEHYFAAARMGMKKEECETSYPKCSLSLYPLNDGFKSDSKTSKTSKDSAKNGPNKDATKEKISRDTTKKNIKAKGSVEEIENK